MPGPRFPGFDHLYELCDPCHWGAVFSGVFDKEPWDSLSDVSRAACVPARPLTVRWHGGRAKPGPVIWPSILGLVVRESVIALLEAHAFTGWTTYDVELRDKGGDAVPGYWGVAVSGRCGPVDDDRCNVAMFEYPAGWFPQWIGEFFDPGTWDGSDFFTPEGSIHPRIFITERVKSVLERARLNVIFERLDTVVRADLMLRPFPGPPVPGSPPG